MENTIRVDLTEVLSHKEAVKLEFGVSVGETDLTMSAEFLRQNWRS